MVPRSYGRFSIKKLGLLRRIKKKIENAVHFGNDITASVLFANGLIVIFNACQRNRSVTNIKT